MLISLVVSIPLSVYVSCYHKSILLMPRLHDPYRLTCHSDGGHQRSLVLNFCLMCTDDLARVHLHRMERGLTAEGAILPFIAIGF